MRDLLRAFVADETGATAIEYSLILAFMALGILAGVTSAGQSLNNSFKGMSTEIDNSMPTP